MNVRIANVIVQGMLKGTFDALDALLTLSFVHNTTDVRPLAKEELNELLQPFPVVFSGQVKTGGGVAFLFKRDDAARFAAMAGGQPYTPEMPLDAAALGTLQEIASAGLGGGTRNLTEKFGKDVELTGMDAKADGPAQAAVLIEILGPAITMALFQFSAPPEIDSTAALLFSNTLEELVPENLVNLVFGEETVDTPSDETKLSDDEMTDILSGFDPDKISSSPASAASPAYAPPTAASQKSAPDNLDIVLDIRLTITARLGRIEMPIEDILALGPGSIIEVGHSVDEPVELLVNDKLIARGDVVVVDEKFGLRITEIVSPQQRIESLR